MHLTLPETIGNFAIHRIAQACPSFTIEQFEDLKGSLEKDGQREPILLYEGKVLDGVHRLYALEQLGIPPLLREFDGTEPEAIQMAFIRNILRRHLTTAQKAQAIIDHEKLLKQPEPRFLARAGQP